MRPSQCYVGVMWVIRFIAQSESFCWAFNLSTPNVLCSNLYLATPFPKIVLVRQFDKVSLNLTTKKVNFSLSERDNLVAELASFKSF